MFGLHEDVALRLSQLGIDRDLPLKSYYINDDDLNKCKIFLMIQEKDGSENIFIYTSWPEMTEEKYNIYLNTTDSLRKKIIEPSCQGEDALLLLGLLAYDLSNILLYNRGSAAITGWLIRAIAQEKGINLDHVLKVNELAFDIYAQVQPSRKQYALDF
ncbi:MAG TPA: hypothetical protein PLD88_07245, partial [Candidatus Berkiella sp.]|nr:hypothetical protein [Candidatus Berkiella sp.]